jgi:hypothetical protein
MALLGVEASDEHKAVLRGLGNGECIFRDLDGRAGRIGIDLISDELRQWLDTNPTRARRSEGPTPPDAQSAPQGAGAGSAAAQGGASQSATQSPATESLTSEPSVSEPVQ